jgi:hypothetical protein
VHMRLSDGSEQTGFLLKCSESKGEMFATFVTEAQDYLSMSYSHAKRMHEAGDFRVLPFALPTHIAPVGMLRSVGGARLPCAFLLSPSLEFQVGDVSYSFYSGHAAMPADSDRTKFSVPEVKSSFSAGDTIKVTGKVVSLIDGSVIASEEVHAHHSPTHAMTYMHVHLHACTPTYIHNTYLGRPRT